MARATFPILRDLSTCYVSVLSDRWLFARRASTVQKVEQPASIAVLLVQLGTPDAPTPVALRRYLREFLSDRRVIDLPRWQWLPILHVAVLPRRPPRSAKLYGKIWTAEGSPLMAISKRQAD